MDWAIFLGTHFTDCSHATCLFLFCNKTRPLFIRRRVAKSINLIVSALYLRRRRAARPAKANRLNVAVVGSGMFSPPGFHPPVFPRSSSN